MTKSGDRLRPLHAVLKLADELQELVPTVRRAEMRTPRSGSTRARFGVLWPLSLVACLAAPIAAAEPSVETAAAAPDPLPGLESFVDGIVASFSLLPVAGVQVAIVKDGRSLLVKSYGLSTLEPKRPVDPERSLFRLASISKTFTWLALMQLQERGKLRLEDPSISTYPSSSNFRRMAGERRCALST